MPSTIDRPAATKHQFKLTLDIDGTAYNVGPLPATQFGELRAFLLIKLGGKTKDVYRVSATVIGPTCTCKATTYRKDAGLCKHALALVTLGMLDQS